MINHVSAVQVNTTFVSKKKKNVARVLKESPFEVEQMYFFSRTHTSLDIKCRCCVDYAQMHSGEGDAASQWKNEPAGTFQRRHRCDLSCSRGGRLRGRAAAVVVARLASREPLGVWEGGLVEAYRVKRVDATCWERSAKLAEAEGRGQDITCGWLRV